MDKAKDYINLICNALSKEEIIDLRTKLADFWDRLWRSNAASAEKSMDLCKEIIDIIDDNIEFDKLLKKVSEELLKDGKERNL